MAVRNIAVSPSLYGLNGLIPPQDWQATVEAAVARWNQALASCCSVRLTVAAPQNRWIASEDGVNLVVLRRGIWCHNEMCGHDSTFPPNVLAMTTVYPEGAKGVQVREADVEVNAQLLRAVNGRTLPKASELRVVDTIERGSWVLGPSGSSNPVPLDVESRNDVVRSLKIDIRRI